MEKDRTTTEARGEGSAGTVQSESSSQRDWRRPPSSRRMAKLRRRAHTGWTVMPKHEACLTLICVLQAVRSRVDGNLWNYFIISQKNVHLMFPCCGSPCCRLPCIPWCSCISERCPVKMTTTPVCVYASEMTGSKVGLFFCLFYWSAFPPTLLGRIVQKCLKNNLE